MKRIFICGIIALFIVNTNAQTLEQVADINEEMLIRAKQFKEAISTSNGYRSGVYIYQKRSYTDYEKKPVQLAARLALLGFTDVYLGMGRVLSSGNRDELKWIENFNAHAHKYGMKVHILTLSSAKLWIENKRIFEDCNEIINYNYSNKKEFRFDGVSADLEPHIMKKGHIDRPKELLWEWHGTDNYGIGKDNDLLCKRMVEVMEKARKELGKEFELSQAQGFFIQGRYDKGELSWGSAHQLLKHCSSLIVMAYNFKPERVLEMARPSLENAKDFPKSISVAIKTSLDTYGSEGPITSFQPQGWDYLINGIEYLIESGSKYSSFRGIDIFEFQGFEKIWDNSAVADKRTNYEKTDSH
jgi:hypothetical protein